MKKNYFLHTAILLVALVCGTVPVWSQTYKKNIFYRRTYRWKICNSQ